MNLNDLDTEEFADELSENLGRHDNWEQFVEPYTLRRTGEALEELEVDLQMQVRTYGTENDPEWGKRIENKLSLVGMRLRQVRRRIYDAENKGRDRESSWKQFAHELCEALEDSDLEPALDDILTPFDDLSARRWLQRRREKRGVAA